MNDTKKIEKSFRVDKNNLKAGEKITTQGLYKVMGLSLGEVVLKDTRIGSLVIVELNREQFNALNSVFFIEATVFSVARKHPDFPELGTITDTWQFESFKPYEEKR